MTGAMFEGLPMRGIWFAPYGTPCPADASSPLGKRWAAYPPTVQAQEVRSFGDVGPVRTAGEYAEMSVVFEAGTDTERARLLLPQVLIRQGYDGPEPGVAMKWMVSGPFRRRLEQRKEQQVNHDDGGIKPFGRPAGGGAATLNAAAAPSRPQALSSVRSAAIQARECGIGVGDIMDEVSSAVTAHSVVERQRKATAAFLAFFKRELGQVLRPEVLDDIAAGAVDQAQILADQGVLLVRDR